MSGRVLCLLSARNLGDAVMHAGALDALRTMGFAERYLVWTFPQAAFLFENVPGVEVYVSSFPMGATRRAFQRKPREFAAVLRTLRRIRPTHALDLIGDVRERTVLRLLGAPVAVSPAWAEGHPFRRHVRGADWWLPLPGGGHDVVVPAEQVNVYDAQRRVLDVLGERVGLVLPPSAPARDSATTIRSIGVHPYASLPCKLWPRARWVETLRALQDRYPQAGFVLFGTPADAGDLNALATEAGVEAEIFTAGLAAFYARVGRLDRLLGLDSVAVHVAHRQGVPSVALIGPNDPRIFTPPSTKAVTHPGHCAFQPCHGKPVCEGTAFEYACMRAIEPAQALAATA